MAKGSYTEVVTCECGAEISRTPGKEIAVDPANHTGNNTTTQADVVPATCMAKGSYTEVVTCECGAEISRTPNKELAIDPENHTGNNTTTEEDIVLATCKEKGSYTEVVVCECGAVLSRTPGKEIAIDPANHADYGTEIRNAVTADCVTEGYSGDTYCLACGEKLADGESTGYGAHQLTYTAQKAPTCKDEGLAEYWSCETCGKFFLTEDAAAPLTEEELNEQGRIAKTDVHTDGEPVIENEVAATCDVPGSYDTVVYCTVCGKELSRETHTVTKDHTPGAAVKEKEIPAKYLRRVQQAVSV